LGIAACHACGFVLDLRSRDPVADEALDRLTKAAPAATSVPMPEKFVVDERPGRFEVRWRWFGFSHVFLGFFSLVWNGFMVMWFGTALIEKEPMMALFGSLHALAGLTVGYLALTGFTNSTRVSLENGQLTVKHGPLPWPGGGSWRRDELAQLYGEEDVRRGRNGVSIVYTLAAMLRDGRRVKLVKGLAEKAQVLWLERTFEGRMQIVDVPVTGEVRK